MGAHRVDRYREVLHSQRWKDLKQFIGEIHGWQCEGCERTPDTVRLELHHLHYRTLGQEQPNDVRLFCRDCHRTEHATVLVLRRVLEANFTPRALQPYKEWLVAHDSQALWVVWYELASSNGESHIDQARYTPERWSSRHDDPEECVQIGAFARMLKQYRVWGYVAGVFYDTKNGYCMVETIEPGVEKGVFESTCREIARACLSQFDWNHDGGMDGGDWCGGSCRDE